MQMERTRRPRCPWSRWPSRCWGCPRQPRVQLLAATIVDAPTAFAAGTVAARTVGSGSDLLNRRAAAQLDLASPAAAFAVATEVALRPPS